MMEQKRARDEEEEEEEEEEVGGGRGGDGGFLKKLCRGLGIVEEEEEELELQRQQQEQDQDGAEVGLDGSGIADREELLSGVIKSLEEEINLSSSAASSPSPSPALPPPPPPPPLSRLYSATSSAELSYLLEASDDELGISIASPALSEADLAGTCCGEDQLRANSILDLLEGEVISLASSDFPEFEEEWIRRTVATMEMVVDSPPPPPLPPCLVDWNGSSLETTGQPLLIESRK